MPSYDPRDVGTGIVHLGIGAFHRAHQADFTHQAPDLLERGWGIVGVTQRSRRVVDQLQPQDGLFTLVQRDPTSAPPDALPRARVIGSVRRVFHAGSAASDVTRCIADPATRIVSTTVTEKGYTADLAHRRLDSSNAAVQADLHCTRPYRTVAGQLVSGLAARAERGSTGITVLCCDNVPRGGDLLQALCIDFLEHWAHAAAEPTRSWIAQHVRFPNTLVDRIVPSTTDQERHTYWDALGYRDEALVTAEPYGLWVIENDFAAGHPSWPAEHVKIVQDVSPWSDLKLRLLNGGHSLLAYLGLALGRGTVAEATRDQHLADALGAWLTEAAASLETVPDGLDVDAYSQDVRQRFSNPAIAHRLDQIAADGSVKLPARVLPVAATLGNQAKPAPASALCLAAWLHHVERQVARRRTLADPAVARLAKAVDAGNGAPRPLVDRVFGPDGVMPLAAALQHAFLDQVASHLTDLRDNRIPSVGVR